MNEFFTTTNIVLLVLLHFAGSALSVAAFGKYYSRSRFDSEERAFLIGISFFLWPICLVCLFFGMLFRKTNK